jgi:peptide alpha-N-acetyltransferase
LSKGKLLLALRAIRRIVELARDSPAAHRSVTRFLHAAALAKAEGPVASVISTQLAAIGVTEGTSASQYNDAYLSKAGSDFAAIVAWAEMKLLLEPAQKKDAVSKLVGASLATASLEGCKEAVALLGSADVDAADRFRKSAQLRFPYAGNFQSKPAASVGGGNA